jgi:hypothetical protein
MHCSGRIVPEAVSLSQTTHGNRHETTLAGPKGGRLADIYGELSAALTVYGYGDTINFYTGYLAKEGT